MKNKIEPKHYTEMKIAPNEYNKANNIGWSAGNVHPLLNPESKHYSMTDGIEAISRMEEMYSIPELMAWAKITAMKYRLRIGNKDDSNKEVKKIKTFEEYYEYLKEMYDTIQLELKQKEHNEKVQERDELPN